MSQTSFPISYELPVFRVQLIREGALCSDRYQIKNQADAALVLRQQLEGADREQLVALFLDTKNKVIGVHTISTGTLDSSLVGPREVYKAALLANAASLILGHNHPSGDPTPSPEDIRITQRLQEAGELMGVDLLDHVIVGDSSYVSLKEKGVL